MFLDCILLSPNMYRGGHQTLPIFNGQGGGGGGGGDWRGHAAHANPRLSPSLDSLAIASAVLLPQQEELSPASTS